MLPASHGSESRATPEPDPRRQPMTNDQLRKALRELNTERDATFFFRDAPECTVANAMLIPDEPDHLVKVSDGKHIYIIDAEHVAWIRIG